MDQYMKLKKLGLLIFLLVCSWNISCGDQQPSQEEGNHLVNETSPYLLQHAYNPVDWYPWGDEAFEKARNEDKPIVISIGYAACHWCHVMEHESFEDSTIAAYMNEHFVSIKVDREERPDVDQIYMNAAQLITGRGGWPLNAFALPDGKPFYAGTYFPKDEWMQLLEKINDLYQNDKERLVESAEKITEGIKESDLVSLDRGEREYTKAELESFYSTFKDRIDFKKGGFLGAPKFPLPVSWKYLLQYGHLTGNVEALEAVKTSLDQMAYGGIYDQLGGGFARYSVDADWFAPHFEKMLYDNGQLVSLYAMAYQAFKDPLYKEIVEETIEFTDRELSHDNGGFFSSLDADSEGEEGMFYVWTWHELSEVLNEKELDLAKDYYRLEKNGNWEEDKNILIRNDDPSDVASDHDLSLGELDSVLAGIEQKLFHQRSQRERPGTDDKVLASWNALMCNGLLDAYRVLDQKEYLDRAIRNAYFVLQNMSMEDGGLYRNFKEGKANIPGFLDDYANWINALTNLYQATFDQKWLDEAARLTDYVIQNFSDPESQMFYYTSDQGEDLIARKMEITDNVTPASNSVMATNLYILGHFLDKKEWSGRAEQMLNNVSDEIVKGGPYYAKWASLYAMLAYNHYEIAIVGEDAVKKRASLEKEYFPNVFYIGDTDESELPLLQQKFIEGSTIIYVCQNKVCQMPVEEPHLAAEMIEFNSSGQNER